MTLTPRCFLITRGETQNHQVTVLTEDELADEIYMHVWALDAAGELAEMAWKDGKTGEHHRDVSVEEKHL